MHFRAAQPYYISHYLLSILIREITSYLGPIYNYGSIGDDQLAVIIALLYTEWKLTPNE